MMDILYSDQEIVVVNKPGGLLSVPGRGPDKQDCVVNRIKQLFPACIAQPSVHRLDMATSGIMVLAFSKDAHRHLSRQFEARTVKKKYMALLEGLVEGDSGTVDLAFRLDTNNRPHQIYDPEKGKRGITNWFNLGGEEGHSRIEFHPKTGRTHQLRLHASHPKGLNRPIVGDSLYGKGNEGDPMMLHAFSLSIAHPTTGNIMEFHSPVPF